MKYIFLILMNSMLYAQQGSVGINTDRPNDSALLHVESFKGRRAVITATISGGTVTALTIADGGSGYTIDPDIIIYGGEATTTKGGQRATATATVTNGSITSVTITNGGTGYTSVPVVHVISGNKGLLIPRVDIQNPVTITTPVSINAVTPAADGLLVFNNGPINTTNKTENSIYWYDSVPNKWISAITTDKTPKITYINLTSDALVLTDKTSGSSDPIIQTIPYIDAVSNIPGLQVWNLPSGNYGGVNTNGYGANLSDSSFLPSIKYPIALPKEAGTYIIEVSLNIITPPATNTYAYNNTTQCPRILGTSNCSKPMNVDGYEMMGYFLDLFIDRYNSSTQQFDITSNRQAAPNPGSTFTPIVNTGTYVTHYRKENPVISKTNVPHYSAWSFVVNVQAPAANTQNVLRLLIGRMQGSTFYDTAKISNIGSHIKIYKVQ